jgi:chorismate mutase
MNSSPTDASESAAPQLENESNTVLDNESNSVLDSESALLEIASLREQIDAVDAELVGVVLRRIALSKQIQAVRMAHGGRRREHSRELKVVNTYVEGLGRGGSQLALTLLELCRGRA